MKKLKIYFLFLWAVFCFAGKSSAQSEFPAGWLGEWKGKLIIYSENKVKSEVAMELHIMNTDTDGHWKWTIVYGTCEMRQERPYELILVDNEKGKYKMDEKNSIIIDITYANNTFYSTLNVEKNLLTAIYRLEDKKIYFELISSDMKSPLVTGQEGDDISIVESYPVNVTQKAVLTISN